jgi:hypothetical protein
MGHKYGIYGAVDGHEDGFSWRCALATRSGGFAT